LPSANDVQVARTVHLRRLRLIRGRLEVGGLGVATARGVIDAVDSDLPLAHSFGVAQRAVSAKIDPRDIRPEALAGIDRLIEGWRVSRENPGRLAAARVLETFESLGQRDEGNWLSRYAAAAWATPFFWASPCRAGVCLGTSPSRTTRARPHTHRGVKMSMTATASFLAVQTRWHRPLLWLSLAMAASTLATLAGLAFDPRVLDGAPLWAKPFKFSISILIYAVTLS
jgi:hypothetical protein